MSEENSPPEEAATYTYPDGHVWYGPLKNGIPHGKGVIKYPDGKLCYEGRMENGKTHGQVVTIFPDGDRYEGEYRNGFQHGRGTYTWLCGAKYKGTWVDSRRHGAGIMTYPNGQKYEGKWEKDSRHGVGTQTWSDGRKFEGYWQHDQRKFGVEWDVHGNKVHEGRWEKDEPVPANDLWEISLDEECCICHGEYGFGDNLRVGMSCQAPPRLPQILLGRMAGTGPRHLPKVSQGGFETSHVHCRRE